MKLLITLFLMTTMNMVSAQKTVPNDMLNTQIYTLPNGLKVYLSVNKTEPKIQTYIAVKAGSKFDPSETTGLAHYLEHLMFKGTPNLGTTNWDKEKVLLDRISDLYEKHKAEKDEKKKKEIYAEIDKLSYEASQYAIPNEYDKIVSSLGASGTNAYTSNDQTVYINTIPSNELQKWMMLESERFQHLTMRLFHTELETVYEEYNISQDNDRRWAYFNMMRGLYPNHPYGTQTTIGEGEHLKNPSMVNINNYFNKYYVPNNIAICLSGDLDPLETMEWVNQYFGSWKSKPITPFKMPVLTPITSPVKVENFGPEEEFLYIGYRTPAANDLESTTAELMDMIMTNGKAGLLDLDLVQKQKILGGSSFTSLMHDAGMFVLYGKPKDNQTLEEVRDLLLAEVDKMKRGDFDEWLITAAVNDLELQLTKSYESNSGRAGAYVAAFTEDIPWEQYVTKIERMRKLSKKDIVDFANKYLGNNYVVSYKRKGDSKNPKVDKPVITPVQLNRDTSSAFYKKIEAVKSPEIQPVFVDFDKEINKQKLNNGLELAYVKNSENNLSKLCLIFDFGKDDNKNLELASAYLKYVGTEKLTSEDFQIEMYKNGLELNSSVDRDKMYITISGLEKNIDKGIDLLFAKLNTCKPDNDAWNNMIQDIIQQRENEKLDKNAIQGRMTYYSRYGANNPMNDVYTNQELSQLNANQIIDEIHRLLGYEHSYFFYGQNIDAIGKKLNMMANGQKNLSTIAKRTDKFKLQDVKEPKVTFVNYPKMVQARIYLYHNEGALAKSQLPFIYLYNDFFGAGLSSIVFQELREQKALAYSAFSYYATPSVQDEDAFLISFIGTQSDKMPTALKEFQALLNRNPDVEIQFLNSRESAMKKIASSRIVRDNIYWTYLKNKELGFDNDLRKDVYNSLKTASLGQFSTEFSKSIMNKKFYTSILGDKTQLDFDSIKDFGPMQEVSIDELFGY